MLRFKRISVRGTEYRVLSSRVHAGMVLMLLEGITSRDASDALRGSSVFVYKNEAALPEGVFFVDDIIGFEAVDQSGAKFGTISEYLELPGHAVWVIKTPDGAEKMIPANPAFTKKIDTDSGSVRFYLIEGL